MKFTTRGNVDLYYYASHAVDDAKIGPLSEYEFENGTVYEDGNGFVGKLNDGTVIDYVHMDKGERLEKLYESVRCVQ